MHPRPPLPRARAPLFREQKQRAAGAKFWSNHRETGGFSCILATQATAQPPPYPIWTDPTDPARRPSDRPIGPLGPYSWAPLGLGLTALRARAPPAPPVFSVFVFSRPPTASDPPGRALTGESKTHRPVQQPQVSSSLLRGGAISCWTVGAVGTAGSTPRPLLVAGRRPRQAVAGRSPAGRALSVYVKLAG